MNPRDEVYLDRNLLALALATFAADQGYNAGFGYRTDQADWPILYIDLPTGQVSFHLPLNLVEQLPRVVEYEGTWDGHTSEEKRQRIWEWLTDGEAGPLRVEGGD